MASDKDKKNLESLAVWCEHDLTQEQEPINADLHFNYWKIPKPFYKRINRHFTRCLDIGILLHNPQKTKTICIFFPFKVQKANVYDLVSILNEKKEVCCAVFNEDCKFTGQGNTDHQTVVAGDRTLDLFKLDIENFSIDEKYNGSVLTITLPERRDDNLYIRIRVLTPNLRSICTINTPANSFLQSAFSKDELVDFRVNEYRVLKNSLIAHIEKYGRIKLQMVHFFFICSPNEDHVFASTPFKNCRFLESGTWDDYTKGHMPQLVGTSPLAYHWKSPSEPDGLMDYSVLVKTRYRSSTILKAIKYLIVFLVLSISASYAGTVLYDKYKVSGASSQEQSTRPKQDKLGRGSGSGESLVTTESKKNNGGEIPKTGAQGEQ